MKLGWVGHFQSSKLEFPLIKTLERIRFSSNLNMGEVESNFDDSTQQSFIPQEINSQKIQILPSEAQKCGYLCSSKNNTFFFVSQTFLAQKWLIFHIWYRRTYGRPWRSICLAFEDSVRKDTLQYVWNDTFQYIYHLFLFTFRSRQQQLECNQIPQQQQRPPSRPSSRQALLQQEIQDQQNFTRSRSLGGYYQQVCWVL